MGSGFESRGVYHHNSCLIIEAVSQFLGHSNIHTSKSIYAPYVEALNQEYVDAIGQQLDVVEPLTVAPPAPGRRGGG